ncbi:NUDIX domain-containing protein [Gordonia amicalis]|uniref:NUDIX domain-containing protein n=1 Tax=Gordonia amicalis TaxID=89053 RepID=UPI00387DCC66
MLDFQGTRQRSRSWGRPIGSLRALTRKKLRQLTLHSGSIPCRKGAKRGASAALFVKNGKILLARRESDGEEPLRWQFPGGEIDKGETGRMALYRELEEELGIFDIRARHIGSIQQHVGLYDTRVQFYLVLGYRGTLEAREDQQLSWVDLDSAISYDLLGPNREILKKSTSVWDTVWQNDRQHYADAEVRKQRVSTKLQQSSAVGMQINPDDVIVDVGAGSFAVADLLVTVMQGAQHNATPPTPTVISIERSATAIESFAHLVHGKTRIIQADASSIPLATASADKVLAFNILEHLEDRQGMLNEAHRLLRPNGELIVCHSNTLSSVFLDRVVRTALKRWSYGYQQNLTPPALRKVLEAHGFAVLDYRVDPPGPDRPALRRIDQAINRAWNDWGRNITLRAIRAG